MDVMESPSTRSYRGSWPSAASHPLGFGSPYYSNDDGEVACEAHHRGGDDAAGGEDVFLESRFRTAVSCHEHEPHGDGHAGR